MKINMSQKGQIFIITAPSGTGKTTIIGAVRKNIEGIGYSVSHTTREPRDGEIDGVHYYFVDKATFKKMIDTHKFVEWALVYEHLYGTSFSSLQGELSSGRDLLLDLDTKGAQAIKSQFPEALSIFILPPSMHVLEERLTRRSKNAGENIALRMNKAIEEIKRCEEYDFIVINDTLEQAVGEMGSIITAQRARTQRRSHLVQRLFQL
jgi:guanylate kinase